MNADTIVVQIQMIPAEERAKFFELIHKLEEGDIPGSFREGLADCEAGRVVDMEVALSKPPPE